MHYTLGLNTYGILRRFIVHVRCQSVSAVSTINWIRGRRLSTTCAFYSASVRSDLSRFTFFEIESQKNCHQISHQIAIFWMESLWSNLQICSNRDLNSNRDRDLPVTVRSQIHYQSSLSDDLFYVTHMWQHCQQEHYWKPIFTLRII